MRSNRAFTFIELGFIMIMITILASIAVPNFLEAQVRAKVSRTRQDMDVMVAALQAYYADWNVYPSTSDLMQPYVKDPWTSDGRIAAEAQKANLVPLPGAAMPTPTPTNTGYGYGGYGGPNSPAMITVPALLEQSGWALKVLTTPMPYLTRILPMDSFGGRSVYSGQKYHPFGYVNLVDARKAIGQEKLSDSRRFYLFSSGPGQGEIPNPLVAGQYPAGIEEIVDYDPSNGTTSGGIIARFGNDQR